MARRITFTPETYRYMYDGLVFPQHEIQLVEERSHARLLDILEAVGEPEEKKIGDDSITLYRTDKTGYFDITEEVDFKLLIAIVKASKPNGLYIRTKLGLLDYFDTVPKLEVEVKSKRKQQEAV